MSPTSNAELIQERVNNLEENYRNFIQSGEVSKISEAFSTFHNFDEETAVFFENGVFLYLIFFMTEESFINYLISDCLLNRNDATLLTIAVKKSLPGYIQASFEATQEALLKSAKTIADNSSEKPKATLEFPIITKKEPEDFSEEIAALEELSQKNNLSRKESNLGETEQEQTYISSQDDILNKN